MRVTLDSIAALAGVSTATVSRSLQQNRLIHPATRAHVLEVAARLGYQGRSRRGSGTKRSASTLGVLLPFRSLKSGHLATMHFLQGITSEADATDLFLRLEEVRSSAKGQMANRRFLPKIVKDSLVDVAILIEPHYPEDVVELSRRLPIVSVQFEYEGATTDLVECANSKGVRTLVDHLVRYKHRRLAWVRGDLQASFFQDREAGFIQGCLKHNLPMDNSNFLEYPRVNHGQFRSQVQNLLAKGVTAFLCANDSSAEQVAKHLLSLGVKIPEDISIAGYDASKYLIEGRLLTSYDPTFIEIGRAAVRLAIQRMAEPSAPPITQMRSGTLFAGETVAIAPPRAE